MALANIDARRLKLAGTAPLSTTSGELNVSLDSTLELNSNQIRISAAGKSAALASKYAVVPVRGTGQANPNATSAAYDPGSGTYGASGDSTKAPLALLKGAGVSSELDTGTGKIGSSASPSELYYKVKIVNVDGEPFFDSSNNQVWGLLACDARSSAADVDVYFFTGKFDSTATAYTLNDAGGFRVIYPQRYDLSDFPEASFMSFVFENEDSASLSADSVKGTHIDFADVLNSTGGLEEQAGDSLGIKVYATGGLATDVNGAAVKLPANSGLQKDANGLQVLLSEGFDNFTGDGTTVGFTMSQTPHVVEDVIIGGIPGVLKATPDTAETWSFSGTTLTVGSVGNEVPASMAIQVRYGYKA